MILMIYILVIMIMENLMEWRLAGETEVLGGNLYLFCVREPRCSQELTLGLFPEPLNPVHIFTPEFCLVVLILPSHILNCYSYVWQKGTNPRLESILISYFDLCSLLIWVKIDVVSIRPLFQEIFSRLYSCQDCYWFIYLRLGHIWIPTSLCKINIPGP
jgi:hypothetical protein